MNHCQSPFDDGLETLLTSQHLLAVFAKMPSALLPVMTADYAWNGRAQPVAMESTMAGEASIAFTLSVSNVLQRQTTYSTKTNDHHFQIMSRELLVRVVEALAQLFRQSP